MTTPSVDGLDAASTDATPPPPRTSAQRRLFILILPVNLAIYLLVGAIPGILLPLQVQAIDAANKAANLALITGIGAFAAMIVSPMAGMLSDRTRSRFGRRTPWLVGGSIGLGLTLVGMGFANGVAQLVIAWVIVQTMLNLVLSPLTALLPDRVPEAVRGTFATLVGIGMMFGALGGQVLGASFASNIQTAYLVLPGVMIVAVTVLVVLCKDTPSTDQVNEPFSLVVFLKTFWVSPRQHPDFAWGFAGRLLLYTGYFSVTGYQLYVLQDYIGLGDDAVKSIPLLGVMSLGAILVSTSLSGPLSDKVGLRKPFVVGASLIMGVGMIMPWLMPTLTGMYLLTAIAGLGFGMYMAVDQALMSQLLPAQDSYAKDLGVLNIAGTLPQTIGPFAAGAIVVAFGYSALFPIALVLAVLGAAAILPIKSVR